MDADTSVTTALNTLAIAAVTVTFILVLLRYYVRYSVSKALALDDYVLALSQTIFIAYITCVMYAIKSGIGEHLMDAENLPNALKFYWLSQVLYVCTITAVKIAVTIFFCSLRPPRILRNIAIGTAYLSVVVSIVYGSFIIFICNPPSYFWRQFYSEAGKCMSSERAYIALMIINVPNILCDVILAALPCIMVQRMNMRRGQKIGVSILLGLSTLPAIVSILREIHTHELLFNITDFTYSAWVITLTEITEAGVGITVTCIAQLRPLFKKLAWTSSSKKSSTGGSPVATFGQRGSNRRAKNETDVSLEELIEDVKEIPIGGRKESSQAHHS